MESTEWIQMIEKSKEWKARMLTTVVCGKRVRCNGGVDPDKAI